MNKATSFKLKQQTLTGIITSTRQQKKGDETVPQTFNNPRFFSSGKFSTVDLTWGMLVKAADFEPLLKKLHAALFKMKVGNTLQDKAVFGSIDLVFGYCKNVLGWSESEFDEIVANAKLVETLQQADAPLGSGSALDHYNGLVEEGYKNFKTSVVAEGIGKIYGIGTVTLSKKESKINKKKLEWAGAIQVPEKLQKEYLDSNLSGYIASVAGNVKVSVRADSNEGVVSSVEMRFSFDVVTGVKFVDKMKFKDTMFDKINQELNAIFVERRKAAELEAAFGTDTINPFEVDGEDVFASADEGAGDSEELEMEEEEEAEVEVEEVEETPAPAKKAPTKGKVVKEKPAAKSTPKAKEAAEPQPDEEEGF